MKTWYVGISLVLLLGIGSVIGMDDGGGKKHRRKKSSTALMAPAELPAGTDSDSHVSAQLNLADLQQAVAPLATTDHLSAVQRTVGDMNSKIGTLATAQSLTNATQNLATAEQLQQLRLLLDARLPKGAEEPAAGGGEKPRGLALLLAMGLDDTSPLKGAQTLAQQLDNCVKDGDGSFDSEKALQILAQHKKDATPQGILSRVSMPTVDVLRLNNKWTWGGIIGVGVVLQKYLKWRANK